MNHAYESVRQDVLMRLLAKAHFDPQSHSREGMDFAFSLVGSLIDQLEDNNRIAVLSSFKKTSGKIADKFNELGYHNSVYNARPISANDVEDVLRERLSAHFTLPPKLGLA